VLVQEIVFGVMIHGVMVRDLILIGVMITADGAIIKISLQRIVGKIMITQVVTLLVGATGE